MSKLFEQRSCTAWAVQTVKNKHRVFPSLHQLLLAATPLDMLA